MIRVALFIWVVVACLHLADARADVGILSGTAPGSAAELVSGLAYTAAWFAAVIVAPILAQSSAFSTLHCYLAGRNAG
jgi:hypothetical protein